MDWDEQFINFFDGVNGLDIDALRIDVNEPANFYNHPYPGNNTTPEAFTEADNDPPEAPAVRNGPNAPIPGFPASLQPNFATNDTAKRAVAVTKRSTSKGRRGRGAGRWRSDSNNAEGSLYLDDGVSVVQDTVSEIDFKFENGKFSMTGSLEYDAGINVETITLLGVDTKPDGAEDADYDEENKKLVLHVDVPLTGKYEATFA